ncbi:MAG: dihydroneopterin aldolase family protein, partial [Methanotrichaceae archaeon]|nr:dihydroneopterin aldolase family protein [Methanotrichaceae archaeon]
MSAESGGDFIKTNREIAAFEAGIKLGALYHQFVGVPVSAGTAPTLE